MADAKFLYDTFNIYYKNGLEAQKQGNVALAKRNLLLASETLLKLAKENTGELRRARIERATRLYEMANSITAENVKDINPKSGQDDNNHNKVTSNNTNKDEDNTLTLWEPAGIPNIHFSDVAGMEDVKESIRMRIILPLRYPEVYKQYNKKIGGGVLLFGPPGTGKTMIAKAIACEVNAKFYSVKCSDVVSKWFGEAEKNIKNLFATARQDEKAIIFFDEFEALATKRGTNSPVMNRLVPELLSQIQGFTESNSQLLLIAATNRPWDIDNAMLRPGRFNELIYVSLPDNDAREFIIKKQLAGIPLDNNINIKSLVEMTEGYSGADVTEFCDRLKEDPILRSISNGGNVFEKINMQDLIKTKDKVKASVKPQDLEVFERFLNNQDIAGNN